jgi:hypothetical protein
MAVPHKSIKPHKTKIGNDPTRQEAMQKRVDIEVRLRLNGFSYREIVEAVRGQIDPNQLPEKYSEDTVNQDLYKHYKRLDEMDRESIRIARRMDLQRLDSLLMVAFNKALGGDLKATEVTLKVMERRAKLLGMDRPSTVQIKDWRSEVLDLIRSGKVTVEDVRQEFGTQIARDILESGGEAVLEGYFTEPEDTRTDAEGNLLTQDAKSLAPRIYSIGNGEASKIP